MNEDVLARIAAALERIAPPAPAPADPLAHPAYVWRDGALRPARAFAPLPLALLEGVDAQKEALVGNMRRLAAGLPAHAARANRRWSMRASARCATRAATSR